MTDHLGGCSVGFLELAVTSKSHTSSYRESGLTPSARVMAACSCLRSQLHLMALLPSPGIFTLFLWWCVCRAICGPGPYWHCKSKGIEGGRGTAAVTTVPERWISLMSPDAKPVSGIGYCCHVGLSGIFSWTHKPPGCSLSLAWQQGPCLEDVKINRFLWDLFHFQWGHIR